MRMSKPLRSLFGNTPIVTLSVCMFGLAVVTALAAPARLQSLIDLPGGADIRQGDGHRE